MTPRPSASRRSPSTPRTSRTRSWSSRASSSAPTWTECSGGWQRAPRAQEDAAWELAGRGPTRCTSTPSSGSRPRCATTSLHVAGRRTR
eukprot:9450946-Alexandrium_andersonii.AAC.1